ncbi:alginate lyase family protein [Romboutsia lituseburensis]|uniref:alginate lyase family protein n=1 Tax=Romboutsia lituseburensis TaxID=1537 RepID=UPI00215A221B|nr:heparinase II/III family protein [Romboutsia lituseburensis]MCR8744828.1 heparinase II/III family protein [Romboutsia lituseburensis]
MSETTYKKEVNMKLDIYLSTEEINEISKYSKLKFLDDVKETIRIADDVCNNKFMFEWKWDMERTFIPYTFEDKIVWDKTPNMDEEWIFMLNRHRYWVTLGKAYALTNDEKYSKVFFYQLKHWIENVVLIEGTDKTTWRTIEAGIRCENWIKAYMYFKESEYLSEDIKLLFKNSLQEHCEYLYNNYHDPRKLSNWGVLESHGLLIVGLALNEKEISNKYINTALERLEEQIELQVMDDGMHWEQSPMYLNEVLHCYIDSIIICIKNNIKIPSIILEKTKKLAYANLYMKKPNHHQICQSDSDDTDLRDMLTKAAYLYNDPVLKYGAYEEIDFESIWDLGYNSIKKYKEIKSNTPLKKSYAFEDSGNYYMRSGWTEEDSYMYFHCGTLGSGHGHADLLHFSVFANKEDYLIDPGRYTYIEGNELRQYLKSCKAHNTTIVNNEEFSELNGSWGYKSVATPIKHPFVSDSNFDYCEGSHLGYINLGVFTNRKIIYIKPDIWLVIDAFYGEGEHEYKQFFHFAHDIVIKDDKTICKGKNGFLTLNHLNDLEKSIEKSPVSYHYNKLEYKDTLTTKSNNTGFTSIITAITVSKELSKVTFEKMPVKNCNNRVLEDYEAEAIKIVSGDKTYIVLICHNEIYKGKKLLNVYGHDVYGKVVVITEDKYTVSKKVIKY